MTSLQFFFHAYIGSSFLLFPVFNFKGYKEGERKVHLNLMEFSYGGVMVIGWPSQSSRLQRDLWVIVSNKIYPLKYWVFTRRVVGSDLIPVP